MRYYYYYYIVLTHPVLKRLYNCVYIILYNNDDDGEITVGVYSRSRFNRALRTSAIEKLAFFFLRRPRVGKFGRDRCTCAVKHMCAEKYHLVRYNNNIILIDL